MSTKSSRRAVTAFAVAAALALLAPPASKASVLGRGLGWEPSPGWMRAAWGFLASLWGEEGTSADPNGAPRPSLRRDEGTSADPDGAPRTSLWAEEGTSADPDGRLRPAVLDHEGTSADPNG